MHKTKCFIFTLVVIFSSLQIKAQVGTNSPYTRFGYGEINSMSFSASRGMGGLGIGYRAKGTINPINPASFSNVDTLSFMFDVAGSVRLGMFKAGDDKSANMNGNFDYITLLFPVTKWMGISLGMNPFATVGYNFSNTDSLKANTPQNPTGYDVVFKQTYEGSGGLSQVYGGVSAKFLKHFSLGVNAYYLFGNIEHNKQSALNNVSGYSSSQNSHLHVSDFRLRYGLQFFTTIKDKHDFTFGAVFENKSSLNGDFDYITATMGRTDTVSITSGFDFPNMYGAGLYYVYDKKFSIGVDYMFQEWGKAKYFNESNSFSNTNKFNLGAEYVPDMYSNKFYKRIRYRAGATLYNAYIKEDDKLNNFSITVGAGIPFRRSASMLNVGLEYGKTGEKSLINENYFKITLSASFVERWFLKNAIR